MKKTFQHFQSLLVFVLGISFLFSFGASASAGSGTKKKAKHKPKVVVVTIKKFKFTPATITVKRGTIIKWVNKDNTPHDVTSGKSITGRKAKGKKKVKFPDGKFHSGLFGKGLKHTTFQKKLTKKGKYIYYCDIHPFMKGTIIVK